MENFHYRHASSTRAEEDVRLRQSSQWQAFFINGAVNISDDVSEVPAEVAGVAQRFGHLEISRGKPESGTHRGPVLREEGLKVHGIEDLNGSVHRRHPSDRFPFGFSTSARHIMLSDHSVEFLGRSQPFLGFSALVRVTPY